MGASGCVAVFDYPLANLTLPKADAVSDASVESCDGETEAQADASADASGGRGSRFLSPHVAGRHVAYSRA